MKTDNQGFSSGLIAGSLLGFAVFPSVLTLFGGIVWLDTEVIVMSGIISILIVWGLADFGRKRGWWEIDPDRKSN